MTRQPASVHQLPVPGVHAAECTCKACLVEAVREVVHQVVAEMMPAAPEEALSVPRAAKAAGIADWTIRGLDDPLTGEGR
jgi:hypothetical protein